MKSHIHIGLISLYVIENSGIRFLAAILRRSGFRVTEIYFKDWINNRVTWPRDVEIANLIRILRERKVDLVGLSVRASAFIDIAEFITEKLKIDLRLPIVWGGIHPTSLPEECIEIADAVCVGEAEEAMLEFMEKFSRSNGSLPLDVANFWVKQNSRVVKNPPRPLVSDLDRLPFMDFYTHRDKFYIDGRKIHRGDPYIKAPMYLLMASRGCQYGKCSFCINTMLNKIYPGGYYYRRRSVKSVMEELKYVKSHFKHLKRIRFDDEIFPVNPEWVEEFCKEYKQIGLPFECHMHPLFVKEDLLRKLKQAGLDSVAVGIQSTERINRLLYNRKETNRDILETARILHRLKLKTCYQVILDDPVSTPEDQENLFLLLTSLPRPFELYLFSLLVYPKTDLADRLLEEGLISENEIEGKSKKAFSQFRVDLAYPRSKLDLFWDSLLVLVSKRFVPRFVLLKLSRSAFLRRHPFPLSFLAQICNLIKMAFIAFGMLVKGELSLALLKRWLNLKSLITQ